ncbi:MAG: Mpv17/PMP22 family protein [Kiritimatiellaeota bacterium]|nr:Mpv17/PMP22 family protein [Kiritimatiellota bacterium]
MSTDDREAIIAPWQAGVRAAKANLIPALVLQAACLCLLLAYYWFPAVERILRPVSEWQREYGVPAAFISRGFFGGLLPGVFMLIVPALRVSRPALTIAMNFAFWGMMGSLALGLYRLQSLAFGTGHDGVTLITKMLVDQSAYTILVAVPLSATFHFWERHDFSFARTRASFPRQWFRHLMLPTLLPNWVVWAPSMMIIYALPEPLQVHFSGLVGCFWTLFCMQVAVHATDRR